MIFYRQFSREGYRFGILLTISFIAMVFFFIVHISLGSTLFTLEEIIATLKNQPIEDYHRTIIMDLRIPRALIAVLVGSMLGLAGAIMQSVTRNPLAEPGLTGVTTGSVLAAVLTLKYGPSYLQNNNLLPLVASIGGVSTVLMVYLLSIKGKGNPTVLVLNGVVVSAVFSSVTSLILLMNRDLLGSIVLWIIGSLNGRVWVHWNIVWPWALVSIPLGLFSARYANILQLGDETASGLGIKVNAARLILLSIAGLLTAGAVSVVGAIGFIGLIGPHIARRMVGEDASRVFPLSTVLTGALLLIADIVAQNLNLDRFITIQRSGGGIPVGAATALLGAPFFLYIMLKKNKGK